MKRQRIRNAEYRELLSQETDDDYDHRSIAMHRQQRARHENVLEAQIQPGDTLQAIALRYNCTISDLKRLNKIEKEIEIHARKTVKVPVNAHTILLSTSNELPIVHKSGQNSPKHSANEFNVNSLSSREMNESMNEKTHNQLFQNNIHGLDEKLLVASVSLASTSTKYHSNSPNDVDNVNDVIMKSDILTRQNYHKTYGKTENGQNDAEHDEESVFTDPLLQTEISDADELTTLRSGPHAIRGAPRNDFTCSGSDCDISWICLLIFILALCFAIPLIYVIYIAEHPEQFNHKEGDSFIVG